MQEHVPINLPLAPAWALNLGAAGKALVLLGLGCFVASLLAFAFLRKNGRVGSWLLGIGCLSVAGAFGTLATLFVKDQFQFKYVYAHSEVQNAFAYKIAAIWSGQEGSFLLWALASSVFLMLTLRGTGPYLRAYGAVGAFFLAALCGILAYESPFLTQAGPDGVIYLLPDGVGLAPSLNNYWVIIHPPTIFLGFGSLIVSFAYACAALIRREYDDWVTRARPWAILSIALLGLGLCMGGFWAYETLGWGGFWKWDPVENVSFVPWVIITAFVHGIIVQVARKKWHFSNLILGATPFLAFCYGTFLTRAGFLDKVSVHSFAQMNESAHKVLLWFLVASLVGFLGLWFVRLRQDGARMASIDTGLRRDAFYRFGNVFLTTLAVATGIGMSVPLIQFAVGQTPKVVEEPLYHMVLAWFFIPIMIAMAIAPFVPWRETTWREILGRVVNAFSLSLFVTGVVLLVGTRPDVGFQMDRGARIDMPWGTWPLGPWMLFLGWLCSFVIIANLWRLIETLRRSPMGIGSFVSHLGVALAMAGLIVSRGLERKQQYALVPGMPALGMEAGGPSPTIELVPKQPFDFFDRDNKVRIKVSGEGTDFVAAPGLYYTVPQEGEPQPTTWPAIQRWLSHDIYLVLYPLQPDTGQVITLKPGEVKTIAGMDWSLRQERTYTVRYSDMKRDGEAGVAGTTFSAQLSVEGPGGRVAAAPQFVLGNQGGPRKVPATIDDVFEIKMEAMDAADKSVTLSLAYRVPIFPVEIYYKPLTILVWAGVGILTLGGLIAAWDRRRRRKPESAAEPPTLQEEPTEKEDALVSVS